MNKKLTDIERYLRTWQGQLAAMSETDEEDPTIEIGSCSVDVRNARPLIDKICADIRTIVDGVGRLDSKVKVKG